MNSISFISSGQGSGVERAARSWADATGIDFSEDEDLPTLIIWPPGAPSPTAEKHIAACVARKIPYLVSTGRDLERVLQWVDGLPGPDVPLRITGAETHENPHVFMLTVELLEGILEAA